VADDEQCLDVAGLAVPLAGGLRETGDPWAPFELVGAAGAVVGPAAEYLKDVQACGRSDATLRSYGMDLLRWFRFCWAAGLEWDQVTRAEARDFCRWLLIAGKPGAGGGYAVATAAHCETVLRHFYDFHLEAGTGPMVNPFPLVRGRAGRPGAHRNPMDPCSICRDTTVIPTPPGKGSLTGARTGRWCSPGPGWWQTRVAWREATAARTQATGRQWDMALSFAREQRE
jgi:Phage integrase, N-terminal SAM-like domain